MLIVTHIFSGIQDNLWYQKYSSLGMKLVFEDQFNFQIFNYINRVFGNRIMALCCRESPISLNQPIMFLVGQFMEFFGNGVNNITHSYQQRIYQWQKYVQNYLTHYIATTFKFLLYLYMFKGVSTLLFFHIVFPKALDVVLYFAICLPSCYSSIHILFLIIFY